MFTECALVEAANQPEHDNHQQNGAEHTAKASASVAAMGVKAAPAAKQHE